MFGLLGAENLSNIILLKILIERSHFLQNPCICICWEEFLGIARMPLTETDCPTGQQTIVPHNLSIAE